MAMCSSPDFQARKTELRLENSRSNAARLRHRRSIHIRQCPRKENMMPKTKSSQVRSEAESRHGEMQLKSNIYTL